MLNYHPYKSNKPGEKHYIITNDNKKVYFGQAFASDVTHHENEQRKQRYVNRHKTNENWSKSGIDTAGFWSRSLLWNLPTIKDSYMSSNRSWAYTGENFISPTASKFCPGHNPTTT